MTFNESTNRVASNLVLVLADLAGYARAFREHDDTAMAAFLDQFYHLCEKSVTIPHGRIVKFIGDACHAVFRGDAAHEAVRAILEVRTGVQALAAQAGIQAELGANLHQGVVVEGLFGGPIHRQYDVIGRAMNDTAMMGRGPGVRISDPVYQQLESGAREMWRRVEPPVTYTFEGS